MDYRLIETCGACPEAYDIYIGNEYKGYMRLRHGYFRVQRECDGETTYEAHPNGDGLFEWEEREKYIRKGLKSLGFHKSFEDKSINYTVGYVPPERY